jgi:hypothetical protein
MYSNYAFHNCVLLTSFIPILPRIRYSHDWQSYNHHPHHFITSFQLLSPTGDILVHPKIPLNLCKSLKEGLEQIDIRSHIGSTTSLSDGMHRELSETNIDCSDVCG